MCKYCGFYDCICCTGVASCECGCEDISPETLKLLEDNVIYVDFKNKKRVA